MFTSLNRNYSMLLPPSWRWCWEHFHPGGGGGEWRKPTWSRTRYWWRKKAAAVEELVRQLAALGDRGRHGACSSRVVNESRRDTAPPAAPLFESPPWKFKLRFKLSARLLLDPGFCCRVGFHMFLPSSRWTRWAGRLGFPFLPGGGESCAGGKLRWFTWAF